MDEVYACNYSVDSRNYVAYSLAMAVETVEHKALASFIAKSGGTSKAAKRLGVSRQFVARMNAGGTVTEKILKQLGLRTRVVRETRKAQK